MQFILNHLFEPIVWLYGGEGLNILLMVLPTRFVSALLRRYGASIGKNVRIRSPLTIHNSATDTKKYYHKLRIGDDCFIGRDCMIDLQNNVVFGDRVTLSHRVMIVSHTDAGNSVLARSVMPPTSGPVHIDDDAYIGVNVTVLQGIRIGRAAVVAAGAIVIKDVPPHMVVGGVPARIIRSITE